MFTDFIEDLKKEIKNNLPGEKAHIKMSPGVRDYFKTTDKLKEAGVLILIYPKNKELHIALIKRTEYNGPHSGQISFPGGKAEKFDKDIINTALRESQEEIGIDPNLVRIIGKLTPLHIPVSNFVVSPIMGFHETTPHFTADPIEVDKIVEIKLKDLLDTKNSTTKAFSFRNTSFIAPVYNPNDTTIWGATAMILSEFLEVVKKNNFSSLV